MTKAQMATRIAKETGMEAIDVAKVIERFVADTKEVILNGGELTIRGFGTFKMKHYQAKKARDIRRNTFVMVPAKDVPTWVVSQNFEKMM